MIPADFFIFSFRLGSSHTAWQDRCEVVFGGYGNESEFRYIDWGNPVYDRRSHVSDLSELGFETKLQEPTLKSQYTSV